jgi:hypothetical protein
MIFTLAENRQQLWKVLLLYNLPHLYLEELIFKKKISLTIKLTLDESVFSKERMIHEL